MKHIVYFLSVILIGALIGSFLGKFVAIYYPTGNVHDLFATEITAGLNPASLDLRVIEVTAGCLFKFNITSVFGMILTAILFKSLLK